MLDELADEACDVARGLLGTAVEVSRVAGSGRNSRIWRVCSGDREFALKKYPPRGDDLRDRLSTEAGALRLMERHCIGGVPRIVDLDKERGYALLTWLDGGQVTTVTDADIDAAINFLAAVHALRDKDWAKDQPLAAEACLSGREIERQLQERLSQLRNVAAADGELRGFLQRSVVPRLPQWCGRAQRLMTASGLDFDAELPQEWRSLVPSDFGFHNSLRRNDGSLAFLDFEYFGWDDPVKLTADILLHPGSRLQPGQRLRFRRAGLQLYGNDPRFADRLRVYMPLFGLRWVLILLNEFIPERWRRRVLAGDAGSWDEAKARQLSRAGNFLEELPEKLED